MNYYFFIINKGEEQNYYKKKYITVDIFFDEGTLAIFYGVWTIFNRIYRHNSLLSFS